MTQPEHVATVASVEEIQQRWHELTSRVSQLEAERAALEHENKALRTLLERVIEHRQKSHSELVLLLAGLVSKLPISDIGVMVSRLVEHNTNVSEVCAAFAKGKSDANFPQPLILKALDQTRRDLADALKPLVEELIRLDTPLETDMLKSLVTQPALFFSPPVLRASRGFVKGQVPRERMVREFGEGALICFNDMTTDKKLNPRPKTEEIMLSFKNDFEAVFQQNPALILDKRQKLLALHERIQRSKAPTEQARSQKSAFQKLSFLMELLHYYENQNTEAPEVAFAHRLPVLIEQLVVTGADDNLDEKLILQAEGLLAFVIHPDHRLMIVNNVGKGGGVAKTLKYVLTLRTEKAPDQNQVIAEFVKLLVPLQKPPPTEALTVVLRLLKPDVQRLVLRAIMSSDRIRREDGEALGRAAGKVLGVGGLEQEIKAQAAVSVEMERQRAWDNIKELIKSRAEPTVIAAAIRDRLHAKYNTDEIRQSWLTLVETDAISLIRTFCHLPYLPDGSTDEIARTVMETYVIRLTHEKYAATYTKVVNCLRNMFRAKPDSPTLLSFIALVKWVDPEAANRLTGDVGMPVPAP